MWVQLHPQILRVICYATNLFCSILELNLITVANLMKLELKTLKLAKEKKDKNEEKRV